MRSILFAFLILAVFSWDPGFYSDGTNCLQWESSCKECTGPNSCSSWETFYMKKNLTTNLWEYCPNGEFYDFTLDVCTSCAGSWKGYWAYQISWFTCSSPNILDLDTLQCVPSWAPTQIQIQDSVGFNLPNFWRSLEYYIDPNSDKTIELGTKTYPYRTSKPVFTEILKHHSHQDRDIIIYLKENTNIYIEDSSSYILNITRVTITSYSAISTSPGMTTITTIDSLTNGISSKAAFHISKDLTLDIGSVVTSGTFSSYEVGSIGRSGDTFQVVRSSITLQNIVANRIAASTGTGVFIYLLYLQDRTIILSKYLII